VNNLISNITDTLLSVFAILWAPVCVAVFLLLVVYALWPSNWRKFFPATRPTGADRSSKQ
jgi:hypothetical protein